MTNPKAQFWPIIIAWFLYGQLIAAGLSWGYLNELGRHVWEAFGQFIPSIARLKDSYGDLPRFHASLMLASMPGLFIALLFADVESAVQGIREKKAELPMLIFMVVIGSLIFVAGFGHRRFSHSFFAFSLGSTLLTAASACFFRLAYCIVFQAPKPSPLEMRNNEMKRSLNILTSFLESQACPVIQLPPIQELCASIRFLGQQYGLADECKLALADLESQPPLVSQHATATATMLIAISKNRILSEQSATTLK